MKTKIWRLLAILVAVSLAACQPAAPSKPAQTEIPAAATQSPAQQNQAAPATPVQSDQVAATQGVPYPGQQNEVQAQPQATQEVQAAPAYPAPGEPKTVQWTEAEAAILKGDVIQIDQAKDLKVTMILKDGSTLVSTEPAFDEVVRAKERCGELCKNIILYSATQ